MDKKYDLTLEGEVFNSLKSDFNSMLNGLLNTMTEKESENAEISIKIKISLTEGTAPDLEITAYPAERDIFVPKFDHTISTTIQIKDKKTGYVGGRDYELIWDRQNKVWAIRPIKDAQRSLFDDDYKEVQKTEGAEPEGDGQQPDGETGRFLPAHEDVIDADFTEVTDHPEEAGREAPPEETSDQEPDDNTVDGYTYQEPELAPEQEDETNV